MPTIKIACDTKDHIELDALEPFQGELKSLSKEDYERLKGEILETGFAFPVYVWRSPEGANKIIGGHQRVRVLRELRDKEKFEIPEVPVVLVEAATLEIAKRRVLQDVAQYGQVERQGLYEFMGEMKIGIDELAKSFKIPEFAIDMSGFKKEFFDDNRVDTPEPAEAGLPPKNPKTKLGDVWILGEHRVICGDSTKFETLDRLLGGIKVDITFTSPPYNANTRFSNTKNDGPLYTNYSDDLPSAEYVAFAGQVLANCIAYTREYVFWNVNYNSNSRSEFLRQIIPHLDLLDETICWKKTALPVPYGLTRTWEPIFVFRCHSDKLRRITQDETAFNYWEINNSGALDESHRAAFPLALPAKAFELVKKAQTILDPFGGSGTTLIAAEMARRTAYLVELDPGYCDVIIERWATMSGQEAVREDGVLWGEVLP